MAIPIFFPIPKTRKGIKILMGIMGVVCLAIAAIAFFQWSAEQKALAETGQPDFNTLPQHELQDGMIMTGSIDLAIDWYAETYEAGYSGARTSDDSEALYYLVPVYDANADGTISIRYFITYKAEPKDFDEMDSIVAQTWDGSLPSTPLAIENAEISTLSDEFSQYLTEYANNKDFYEHGSFIDWCIEYNILGTTNREAIASKLVPYVIYRTSTVDITVAWLFLGFAVLSFGIMLIMIFVKAPIKGVEENPVKEDFSKLRELDGQSIEGDRHQGSDF